MAVSVVAASHTKGLSDVLQIYGAIFLGAAVGMWAGRAVGGSP
jgi:hypothetical protein